MWRPSLLTMASTVIAHTHRYIRKSATLYGRVRLADLITPVAEAFLKDQITIGHALLIAKLPASQQQEAFAAAFRGMWTSEGNSQILIPLRELAAWIESNILPQLASAPFDKQNGTLVPEAGSCANCPKRTGFNKLLFADVRKDSLRPTVFERRFRIKRSASCHLFFSLGDIPLEHFYCGSPLSLGYSSTARLRGWLLA